MRVLNLNLQPKEANKQKELLQNNLVIENLSKQIKQK